MDQNRARGIAVDLCGLNLINQPLILDINRLFANSVTFQLNLNHYDFAFAMVWKKIWIILRGLWVD